VNGAFVDAIGLIAPGLASWESGVPILSGTAPYAPQPIGPIQPALLPANERRRAPLSVRIALRAAEEATSAAGVEASALASVFATSDADMEIIHRICAALAEPERTVSPTDFHNSVHNAASGYWSIGIGARGPSTALSAYDFNLAAGLQEALALLSIDDIDVLLVLFDVPPPPPLYAARPVAQPAAVALLLCRQRSARTLAQLSICEATAEKTMADAGLEALRRTNPAARALPLLQLLAQKRSGIVGIRSYDDRFLGVRIEAP